MFFQSLIIIIFFALMHYAEAIGIWGLIHLRPYSFLMIPLLLAALWFDAQNFIRSRKPEQDVDSGEKPHTPLSKPIDSLMATITFALQKLFRARAILILLPLFSGALFYLFRQRFFAPPPFGSGDSLLLMSAVPAHSEILGYLDSFDELLELWLHSNFYLAGKFLWGASIDESYALLSSISGAFYIFSTILFLRKRSASEIGMGLTLFWFSPAMLLYFGYAENYSLAAASMAALIMFASSALEKSTEIAIIDQVDLDQTDLEQTDLHRKEIRNSSQITDDARLAVIFRNRFLFPLVGMGAAICVLLHLITSLLTPALIYFTYKKKEGDSDSFIGRSFGAILPAAGLLLLVWFYFLFFATHPVQFGDSHLAHPPLLRPAQWFSISRLSDFFSLILLGAPLGAIVLLSMLLKNPFQRRKKKPAEIFALIAFLSIAGEAFFHNPHLSYPADWDLMTLFQFPFHLYIFYRWTDCRESEKQEVKSSRWQFRLQTPVLAGLGLVLLMAWVSRHAQTDESSELHLNTAIKISNKVVSRVKRDSVYLSLQRPGQRKLYVRIQLFLTRAEEITRYATPERTVPLHRQIRAARYSAGTIFASPYAGRANKLSELWKDLGLLNKQITSIARNL